VDRWQVEEARRSRATLAAMTPEERTAVGLPETSWERVVWGGIGLEHDEGPAGGTGGGTAGRPEDRA
jgi:hypothetical protein